jgi:hypothetical protein
MPELTDFVQRLWFGFGLSQELFNPAWVAEIEQSIRGAFTA